MSYRTICFALHSLEEVFAIVVTACGGSVLVQEAAGGAGGGPHAERGADCLAATCAAQQL